MKLNFDLNIHFWIGLAIFVASAISTGTIHLTNAIPDAAIPYVTAWAGIFNVIGTGYLTSALAMHNASPASKIDAAAALPEVKGIVTATAAIAEAAPSDKVVSAAADIPPPVVEVKVPKAS